MNLKYVRENDCQELIDYKCLILHNIYQNMLLLSSLYHYKINNQ